MKKNIMNLTVLVLPMLLLAAGAGFAAEHKKALPVKTEATSVKPEKVTAAPAEGEQINWQVISSGGTKGASIHFGLNGTVAQPAVDSGSSTHYKLISGFWQNFGPSFICGDANANGLVNIADVVYLVQYIFNSGPAPSPLAAGDVNCNGIVNIADVVYLVQYIFNSGPAPCAACK